MPRRASSPACRASSSGSQMPAFAMPSAKRRTRATASGPRPSRAGTSAPENRPSERSVLPRVSRTLIARAACALPSASIVRGSRWTIASLAKETRASRSAGKRPAATPEAAARAASSLAPCIEPLASTTRARSSGRRGAVPAGRRAPTGHEVGLGPAFPPRGRPVEPKVEIEGGISHGRVLRSGWHERDRPPVRCGRPDRREAHRRRRARRRR